MICIQSLFCSETEMAKFHLRRHGPMPRSRFVAWAEHKARYSTVVLSGPQLAPLAEIRPRLVSLPGFLDILSGIPSLAGTTRFRPGTCERRPVPDGYRMARLVEFMADKARR